MNILKKDNRLWDEETLNKTLLFELLDKYDDKLFALLLSDKDTKAKYFIKAGDSYVFKYDDFKFFIEQNSLDGSYTKYENTIGLSDKGKFLSQSTDYVLDWPYKDTILVGGMSSEEDKENYIEEKEFSKERRKREEIFYNNIIAQDEIDRLKDNKALKNFTRYSKKGREDVKKIDRDKDGTIMENLLIKGNNLLALYSLKDQFAGKVKLIYIDPPYNTGGDTDIFAYNNRFKHSTWLTFMKNRLQVASEFLSEDGFIAITIDHQELYYLGAIADEIFGETNRVGLVTIYINPKGRQHERFFSASTEYMLVYAKDINQATFRNITIDEEKTETFDKEDELGKYRLDKFARIRSSTLRDVKPNFYYPIYVSPDLKKISSKKIKGYTEVFPIENGKEYSWKTKKDTFEERLENNQFEAIENDGEVQIYNKYREQQVFKNLWTDKKYFPEFQGTNMLKKIIGNNSFSYPKSLFAVLDTLKIMTSKNDIIMDFFAGSSTTGHAVLELNKEDGGDRKFILIEQISDQINIGKKRLSKVISSSIDKVPSGYNNENFIYLELAEYNEEAKNKIESCKNYKELKKLFTDLTDYYFLNYNIAVKDFNEKVLNDKDFQELPIDKQKKLFKALLDNNQLYISYDEQDDSRFNLTKEDKNLTQMFYE